MKKENGMTESNHDGTPVDAPDKFESEGRLRSEQFKNLQASKQVLDWWQKELTELRYGYQGVTHTLNKYVNDLWNAKQELLREIDGLKEMCERLAIERDSANAAVGQLQVDLLAVSERMDRMSEWAKKQKSVT